ncbi:MAG TPA: alpha-isopropylmalate synthase regulatory domain-containing protein, partial [Bacteroidales bacterium]|nr:alpha-isopropylmalate synthase regulatory domain-containing protein [Bacteroidales bacterium]
QNKNIRDEDLQTLIGGNGKEEKKLQLISLQVVCGSATIPSATVKIKYNDEVLTESASGNGPVDAAFTAVRKIVKRKIRLEEFLIQAITQGSDDVGKVHIQVENRGKMYYGFSAHTDIITASVEAYLDAVSKFA